MTDDQKWAALHKTALSDHEPTCNYGQTNGREMCTCQILVDLVEGAVDEPTFQQRLEAAFKGPIIGKATTPAKRVAAGDDSKPARPGGSTRSEQRARRLAQRRADTANARSKPGATRRA